MKDELREQWEALKERHFHYGEPRDWAAYDAAVLAMFQRIALEARIDECEILRELTINSEETSEFADIGLRKEELKSQLEQLGGGDV